MHTCSAVSTPYVKPTQAPEASASRGLPSKDATLYRRAAARVNYIALDWPDLSFASRVAASKMRSPKVRSQKKKKMLQSPASVLLTGLEYERRLTPREMEEEDLDH